MMIDKRLIEVVPKSRRYIAANVLFQWISLLANITIMTVITILLEGLYEKSLNEKKVVVTVAVILIALLVRFVCMIMSSRMGFCSSREVKQTLRKMIYTKLLHIGTSYKEQVKTSEIVQVAVEGVDQLETYFASYLPQFFYAILAPLTLFVCLCFVNVETAFVLLFCVPLIPVAIVVVQKWAKKLLGKYWGQYTALGDIFLENLQGLTTLKIYQADAYKQEEMNEEAEKFRKITMKVLTMQLNSITIMDLIAYGGAAVGIIMALTRYRNGSVSFQGCLLILLLAADFFLPMRQLGSFFHIAMNGMAASEKIFCLLDLQVEEHGKEMCPVQDIACRGVCFSYDGEHNVVDKIDLDLKKGSFVALVGESGCGKSTIAGILTGKNRRYSGLVSIGDVPLCDIAEESLMKNITYVNHQSHLFKGTVRDNLLMGNPQASEEELWEVLERVKIAQFFREEDGLDTQILERASNLSGGQRQRLALARALLHDSPVYIFDEATSNIDVESENDIMAEICRLAEHKTVLVISHRLANTVHADKIYAMEHGKIKESGLHNELLDKNGIYRKLWDIQQRLENLGTEGESA